MTAQWDSQLSVLPVAWVQFPTMVEYLEGFFPGWSHSANLNLLTVWAGQQYYRLTEAMVATRIGPASHWWSHELQLLRGIQTDGYNGETLLREVEEQQLYYDRAARPSLCIFSTPRWQAHAYLESDKTKRIIVIWMTVSIRWWWQRGVAPYLNYTAASTSWHLTAPSPHDHWLRDHL